jgi:flagellar motor component MotA
MTMRLLHLICDTVRLMVVSQGTSSPMAVEEVMDNAIKTHHHDELKASTAIGTLAGALPALGIVSCVMGVVKTMDAIDQPPAVLGGLVGAALVGTFIGVFLAYGFFEPFAKRLEEMHRRRGRHVWCGQTDHHRHHAWSPDAADPRRCTGLHQPPQPAQLCRSI